MAGKYFPCCAPAFNPFYQLPWGLAGCLGFVTLTGFLTIIWQQFILCENFVKLPACLPPKIFMWRSVVEISQIASTLPAASA